MVAEVNLVFSEDLLSWPPVIWNYGFVIVQTNGAENGMESNRGKNNKKKSWRFDQPKDVKSYNLKCYVTPLALT